MPLRDDVLAALGAVNPSAPSTTQMRGVEQPLGAALGYPDRTYAISVSQLGNLTKQAGQSKRARRAQVLVVCLRTPELVDGVERIVPQLLGTNRLHAVLVVVLGGEPKIAAVIEPADGQVHARLTAQWPGIERRVVAAKYDDLGDDSPAPRVLASVPGLPKRQGDEPPLILDPVVRRMLRLALASYRAVMLVGPPGTGKTTLIEEVVRDASEHPERFGLEGAPRGLRVVTPEESWSARELVGGETVDDQGRLRFAPGHVLRAVAADEWLVLDEANRADLDRIFGALLTWLSGKAVNVGSVSGARDAAPVRLEWSSEAQSSTENLESIENGAGPAAVYRAGGDWRLLGTYNAIDSQRVFRLGQALGRRFTRVPVPPVDRRQFLQALQPRLEELPSAMSTGPLEEALAGLYEAHLDLYPPLGPAVFLAVPAYVARGLALEEMDTAGPEPDDDVAVSGSARSDPEGPARQAASERTTARAHQLLTESYLLGAGTALAGLDDAELERLRARVVDRHGLLSASQWAFIESLLPALR